MYTGALTGTVIAVMMLVGPAGAGEFEIIVDGDRAGVAACAFGAGLNASSPSGETVAGAGAGVARVRAADVAGDEAGAELGVEVGAEIGVEVGAEIGAEVGGVDDAGAAEGVNADEGLGAD